MNLGWNTDPDALTGFVVDRLFAYVRKCKPRFCRHLEDNYCKISKKQITNTILETRNLFSVLGNTLFKNTTNKKWALCRYIYRRLKRWTEHKRKKEQNTKKEKKKKSHGVCPLVGHHTVHLMNRSSKGTQADLFWLVN